MEEVGEERFMREEEEEEEEEHERLPFSRLLTFLLVSVIRILWIGVSSCWPSFL